MPANTIFSTSSHHHHRIHLHGSHSLKYRVNEDTSDSTVSESTYGVQNLVVGGQRQRRVRPEVREIPLKESRSRVKRAMTSPYSRRTYSESKTNAKETYVKEPRVVTREVRRKSDSENRHHHRKPEEKAKEERVYAYKTHRKSEGEADRSRPTSTLRRSTTNAGEASKTKHERPRTADRESRRRHSERRTSHNEEKAHTPLRHEKRSIADHVPKSTRDRAPITRYITFQRHLFVILNAGAAGTQRSARPSRPRSFPDLL